MGRQGELQAVKLYRGREKGACRVQGCVLGMGEVLREYKQRNLESSLNKYESSSGRGLRKAVGRKAEKIK